MAELDTYDQDQRSGRTVTFCPRSFVRLAARRSRPRRARRPLRRARTSSLISIAPIVPRFDAGLARDGADEIAGADAAPPAGADEQPHHLAVVGRGPPLGGQSTACRLQRPVVAGPSPAGVVPVARDLACRRPRRRPRRARAARRPPRCRRCRIPRPATARRRASDRGRRRAGARAATRGSARDAWRAGRRPSAPARSRSSAS